MVMIKPNVNLEDKNVNLYFKWNVVVDSLYKLHNLLRFSIFLNYLPFEQIFFFQLNKIEIPSLINVFLENWADSCHVILKKNQEEGQ